MQTQKVLVIVPAYNEERAIPYVVKDLHKKYPHFSVLVIDDGSTDDTAQEAAKAGAAVVSLPINLGIGGAVQTGLKIADADGYDAAVQVDGDAQHDIAYLKDVVRPVLAGEFDLCIGSRFLRTRSGFRSTFLRRIGIRFFSWLLRRLTGVRLTDPTSGYRAFSRLLIEQFALSYPSDFPEPETIQRAKRLGAKIGEVPVKMRKRLGGISSIRYLKTIYYMIKVTLAILIDTLRLKKETRNQSAETRLLFLVTGYWLLVSLVH